MPARVEMFGVEIDPLRLDQAVAQVQAWVANSAGRCQYVVTPNVDHVVMLEHHAGLRAAYRNAGMVLADGAPMLWSSRLLSRPVPERVSGLALVAAVFAATIDEQPLKVYLLGADPKAAERAATNVRARWPAVEVVGTYSPPAGFERSNAETEAILGQIAATQPDVLVVGFGAPQQELWVHAHRDRLAAKVALCVSTAIDFLAGEHLQAASWMQEVGLEWLYRLAREPRRLVARYAKGAITFPRLVAREWWRASRLVHS